MYRGQQKSFGLSQYESEFSVPCNRRCILFIQKTILQTLRKYLVNLTRTGHISHGKGQMQLPRIKSKSVSGMAVLGRRVLGILNEVIVGDDTHSLDESG